MGGELNLLDTPLGIWLLLVWLFVLGSFFGSFANVVIYRLPLGQSLLWPGSHCPNCHHPIRWYDNVPVFGWLILNGRCRDCRTPFSVRYPLVESLFGLMLAALGWIGLVQPHSNLPKLSSAVADAVPPSHLVGYYMLLLGTLVVAALIELDGRRIPLRLPAFTLCCGLILPPAWSAMRLPPEVDLLQHLRSALIDGLAGIGAGALLGCLAWPAIAQVRSRRWPSAVVLALATIGAFLGWQAVCGIVVIAVACDLLAAIMAFILPSVGRIGWSTWLAIATAVWVVCWSAIVRTIPAFGTSQLQLAVVAGAAVALVSIVDWQLRYSVSARATTR